MTFRFSLSRRIVGGEEAQRSFRSSAMAVRVSEPRHPESRLSEQTLCKYIVRASDEGGDQGSTWYIAEAGSDVISVEYPPRSLKGTSSRVFSRGRPNSRHVIHVAT